MATVNNQSGGLENKSNLAKHSRYFTAKVRKIIYIMNRNDERRSIRMRLFIQEAKKMGLFKTQKELASMLGLSDVAVSLVVNGEGGDLLNQFLTGIAELFGDKFNTEYLETGVGTLTDLSPIYIVNGDANAVGVGNSVILGDDRAAKRYRMGEAVKVIKKRGLASSKKEIASMVGVSPSQFSHIALADERYFTFNQLNRFNNAFGGIFNLEYLMEGKGELLSVEGQYNAVGNSNNVRVQQTDNSETTNNNTTNNITHTMDISHYEKIIQQQQQTIDTLTKTIESLTALLNTR